MEESDVHHTTAAATQNSPETRPRLSDLGNLGHCRTRATALATTVAGGGPPWSHPSADLGRAGVTGGKARMSPSGPARAWAPPAHHTASPRPSPCLVIPHRRPRHLRPRTASGPQHEGPPPSRRAGSREGLSPRRPLHRCCTALPGDRLGRRRVVGEGEEGWRRRGG
jgi:hypothetical protein